MLGMAMEQLFFVMMQTMLKEVMPGGNFECTFSICSFGEHSYISVINTYYGNFEATFDNGEDAMEYIKIAPTPSGLQIPDPEADFSLEEEMDLITVQAIPLEIGQECYISVKDEKVKDWLKNYEELGNISFRMESVYPMEF